MMPSNELDVEGSDPASSAGQATAVPNCSSLADSIKIQTNPVNHFNL